MPVGTADKVRAQHRRGAGGRAARDLGFDVVSNPEFLKEGAAVADCMRPDRIVIGTSDPESEELLREVYAPFSRNHDKIIVMDVRSAELTKYAANCMLATKISFMNEIAGLAERLGADVEMVRQGIGSDQRIGYHFIYPGAGYGGSCFPKDVKALIHTARDGRLRAERAAGGRGPQRRPEGGALRQDRAGITAATSKGRTFALWGLAFKPNTDDMREAASPRADGGALGRRAPGCRPTTPRRWRRRSASTATATTSLLCGTKEAALKGADALVVLTEWQAFRAPDFDLIARAARARR